MTRPAVSDTTMMIAGMTPVLVEGVYVFCTMPDRETAARGLPKARAMFAEAEGCSLILPAGEAERLGLSSEHRMRQITLMVYSSLDGIGLTAAVSARLTEAGIPCNIVAANLHDHVFVPERHADRALAELRNLQSEAAGG